MEYHQWRADVSPAKLQEKHSIDHLGNYDQMMCNLCKNINDRKHSGFPKQKIASGKKIEFSSMISIAILDRLRNSCIFSRSLVVDGCARRKVHS